MTKEEQIKFNLLDSRIDRLAEEYKLNAPQLVIDFEKELIKKSFEELLKLED